MRFIEQKRSEGFKTTSYISGSVCNSTLTTEYKTDSFTLMLLGYSVSSLSSQSQSLLKGNLERTKVLRTSFYSQHDMSRPALCETGLRDGHSDTHSI